MALRLWHCPGHLCSTPSAWIWVVAPAKGFDSNFLPGSTLGAASDGSLGWIPATPTGWGPYLQPYTAPNTPTTGCCGKLKSKPRDGRSCKQIFKKMYKVLCEWVILRNSVQFHQCALRNFLYVRTLTGCESDKTGGSGPLPCIAHGWAGRTGKQRILITCRKC